ncbi:MAG: hypothetical protein JNM93_03120 [Bacteriovoracaceae bacterium]|nr:hypothetical protein [Bacteriovoracaceae bacterium]
MNEKRFWFSIGLVWTTLMLTDWFFHGYWMQPTYQATAHLWRPMNEIASNSWAMWVGHAFFAWSYVWIYTKGISNHHPWHQAFRYAVAVFCITSVPYLFMTWAVTPMTTDIIFRWFMIEAFQVFVCGFVVTWFYRAKIKWTETAHHHA